MAEQAPILSKRAQETVLVIFFFFQREFGLKFNLLCCEIGFIIKYFLPKTPKTMHKFFCNLLNFSLKMDGKLLRPGNSEWRSGDKTHAWSQPRASIGSHHLAYI